VERRLRRGLCRALGKSLIILHGPEHQHALKEVDAAALAVAEEPRQVVEILRYVLTGAAGLATGPPA
jgi:hypothetical protein